MTHNKLENTTQCMVSLYENTPEPFRLIVVDDSTDVTPQYFEWLAKQPGHNNIVYLRPDFHIKSSSQVVNWAMQYVESDYFVFLCNSTFVEPGWLPTALDIMNRDPKAGIVGFKLLFWPHGTIIEAANYVDPVSTFRPNVGMHAPSHQFTHIREVQSVGWAVVLVRKAAMMEQPLDEDYYIGFAGPEDTDICLEFKRRGWKIIYNGIGSAYHKCSSSNGGGTPEGIANVNENWRRFKEKWMGRVPV
jgi:GT2 family glycosyltransferase